MIAMSYMQESLTSLGEQNVAEISPAHMCALILYAGIKSNDESFTMDEAKALALNIGAGAYGEIMGMFNKSVIESMNDEDKKSLKKIWAQRFSQAIQRK